MITVIFVESRDLLQEKVEKFNEVFLDSYYELYFTPDLVFMLKMSDKFIAVLGYVTGEEWTIPTIEDILITSDDKVFARLRGKLDYDQYIGMLADYDRNIRGVAKAAALTEMETKMFLEMAKLSPKFL